MISKNEKPSAREILGVQTDSIKAEIVDMSHYYSGHSDQAGILQYIFSVAGNPKYAPKHATVFLNHGSIHNLNQLKNKIETYVPADTERSIDKVIIPGKNSEWFDLDKNAFDPCENKLSQDIIRLLSEYNMPLSNEQLDIIKQHSFH